MSHYSRTVSLRVVESGGVVQAGNAHVVRLGDQICVSPGLLEEYCFANPEDIGYDLMALVGAVKYADRAFTRHHRLGWGRQIKIQLPMFELDRWKDPDLIRLLQDCLGFLTGDEWHFRFTRRRTRPEEVKPGALLEHSQQHVFIPYSHGLDSYSQLKLLSERDQNAVPICVFTSSSGSGDSWKAFCRKEKKKEIKTIPVPVKVSKLLHQEPSFRTRPFLYYSLTAYGAYLAKSNKVLIPENGQGSLGGSLVTMGSEAKHRSCHPAFTKRLSNLLSKIIDKSIEFAHPEIFRTKGEVIAEVAKKEETTSWFVEHLSCSHDQRHSHIEGKRVHCGICGNCLLRRVSASAAKLMDETKYLFSDLTQPTVEQSAHASAGNLKAIKAFEDVAGNGIRSMQRLADLADDESHPSIWTEAASVAEAMNMSVQDVHRNIMRLLEAHKQEWSAFLNECGPQSWVSEIARN